MPQDNRMMTGAAMTPKEMARENIPSNMDMGMNSMMPQMQMDRDALLEIDFLMKRFNLTMDQAVEAVAMTRDTGVRPEEFGGQQMQAPMPRPQTMGGQQMPQQLGALPQMPPQAPPPRPGSMSADRTQSMEMQKYNMGT